MSADRVTSLSPWHVVLVLDDSVSMAGVSNGKAKAEHVNDALNAFVKELRKISKGKKPYFRVGVISFGTSVTPLCEMQNENDIDLNAIATFKGTSGSTNLTDALRAAKDMLERNPGQPQDFVPYVWVMSDGMPDDPAGAIAAASEIKNLSLPSGKPHVISIGIGNDADIAHMRQLSTGPELCIHLEESESLKRLFPQIGTFSSTTQGADALDRQIATYASSANFDRG